jgi:hypothetical protein
LENSIILKSRYSIAGLFIKHVIMKKLLFGLSALALLSACSSNNKRLIIMSKGAADVNTDTRTITTKDGAGHDEKTIDITGEKLSFQLSSPAGNSSVDIADNGLYVINVKNDTIVGGYQPYADPQTLKKPHFRL